MLMFDSSWQLHATPHLPSFLSIAAGYQLMVGNVKPSPVPKLLSCNSLGVAVVVDMMWKNGGALREEVMDIDYIELCTSIITSLLS